MTVGDEVSKKDGDFNPEKLEGKKIDEISLEMIFVQNKKEEMRESQLSDSCTTQKIK